MTAKDKAKEIFETFYKVKDPLNKYPMCFDTAKECALICVDEIFMLIKDADPHELSYEFISIKDYWDDVKKEIKKL